MTDNDLSNVISEIVEICWNCAEKIIMLTLK